MSERKQHDPDHAEKQSRRDDIEEDVLAADDTGMVRNEADMIVIETEEGFEKPKKG